MVIRSSLGSGCKALAHIPLPTAICRALCEHAARSHPDQGQLRGPGSHCGHQGHLPQVPQQVCAHPSQREGGVALLNTGMWGEEKQQGASPFSLFLCHKWHSQKKPIVFSYFS